MSEHPASPAMWDVAQEAPFLLASPRVPHDLQAEGGKEPEAQPPRPGIHQRDTSNKSILLMDLSSPSGSLLTNC